MATVIAQNKELMDDEDFINIWSRCWRGRCRRSRHLRVATLLPTVGAPVAHPGVARVMVVPSSSAELPQRLSA